MNIIKTLQNKNKGNSIIDVLYGHDISNQFEKDDNGANLTFNALGENALISDLGDGVVSIGEYWTIKELDNGNLVFYYKGSERYRIEQ